MESRGHMKLGWKPGPRRSAPLWSRTTELMDDSACQCYALVSSCARLARESRPFGENGARMLCYLRGGIDTLSVVQAQLAASTQSSRSERLCSGVDVYLFIFPSSPMSLTVECVVDKIDLAIYNI